VGAVAEAVARWAGWAGWAAWTARAACGDRGLGEQHDGAADAGDLRSEEISGNRDTEGIQPAFEIMPFPVNDDVEPSRSASPEAVCMVKAGEITWEHFPGKEWSIPQGQANPGKEKARLQEGDRRSVPA